MAEAHIERAMPAMSLADDSLHAASYIQARTATARPRQTLKHNDMFVVLDSFGDIGASLGGPDGLFHKDTRYLSRLELALNGRRPLLLGSNMKDDNLNLYADLTNPDIYSGDSLILPKDTIHIGRTIFVRNGVLRQRIALVNYGDAPVDLTLSFSFDNDFADLFEVRGMRRERRGRSTKRVAGTSECVLGYLGLDGQRRETAIKFHPDPDTLAESNATYAIRLEAQASKRIFVSVSCHRRFDAPASAFVTDLLGARREIRAATASVATVETGNKVLNEILCQSMSDLYMLISGTPHGPYPYAGIPWYSTPFGRDGLITAMQMLWFDPRIAQGVLKYLAYFQADTADAAADAAPGKILHEMRGGEMAALREIPFGLYYGSVDSTPLFVILAGLYAERTGDWALIGKLWPAIDRALTWMTGSGDPDGDGFVEYARGRETGLANQGWKDSHDAVFHADGRLAEGPIALVEVQGYVYLAKRLAANLVRHLGDETRGRALDAEADALRVRFEAAFWSDDLGGYALALDGEKKPCLVRTSNAAHAMFTGIMRADRAAKLARDLMQPSFFSGWGIRTVAAGEARYNPMSYHNGSIWPHDNALIAKGFARYGFKREIETLFDGIMEAASYMEHRRLPELFCGFRRRRARGPTLYPVACSPQAWASGTVFQMLEAMLGLELDPQARRIHLSNPVVPPTVGEITIRNLKLRDASADFRVRYEGGKAVSLQILRTSGEISVAVRFDAPRSDAQETDPGALENQ